jgi:hypothetical protein
LLGRAIVEPFLQTVYRLDLHLQTIYRLKRTILGNINQHLNCLFIQ